MNDATMSTKNTASIQEAWESCDSPIFRVLDEDGNNVADCQIRHFLGQHWLCVDDMDGYTIIDDSTVETLCVVAD